MTSNDGLYPFYDNRPFILTRGTFTSSGSYGSHWLGDNKRTWEYMRYSISGIMSMNMFGIPHTGADVCGSESMETDDEMCMRWIQLATFYPLARFNYVYNKPNEPYLIQGQYKDAVQKSMLDRY